MSHTNHRGESQTGVQNVAVVVASGALIAMGWAPEETFEKLCCAEANLRQHTGDIESMLMRMQSSCGIGRNLLCNSTVVGD